MKTLSVLFSGLVLAAASAPAASAAPPYKVTRYCTSAGAAPTNCFRLSSQCRRFRAANLRRGYRPCRAVRLQATRPYRPFGPGRPT